MIDPNNIVRYNYTDSELEELLIFCVCVAGKKASTIAPRVDKLMKYLKLRADSETPLRNGWSIPLDLWSDLRALGIGCYHQKAEAILQIVKEELDLRACTVKDLEDIKGIGPKTARFFIMCSRERAQHAALDTHLLKWLKEQGVECPKSTPSAGKTYNRLEREFLSRVPAGMTPAEFDLEIWKRYANANTGVTTVYP